MPGFFLLCGLLGISWHVPHLPPGRISAPPDPKTIRTELGLSPEELVRNVFAAGTCDNITQIKGLGNPLGVGYFENGDASIGLARGIILSTGPVSHAAGANSTGDRSGDFGDKTSDPDLSKLATGSIRDRVGLEFDFVPLDSFVTFRYVFASEEYCEFVGSKYNDVFGFFVRGPGIEGGFTGNAKNVALIPGSEDFVSINNVNHKKNKQHYIDNTRRHDAERCGVPYVFSVREEYIEYDGFTVKLTAKLKLNPCETYHIRLVVADVADNFYDSAVFLEAGSFDLGGQISVETVQVNDGPVSEGCSNAYFEFSRDPLQATEFPVNVRFKLTDNTTATPGVDFAALPASVTIPAGHRSLKLPVEIYNDDLEEGIEKIGVELDIPCACYSSSAEMTIDESPPLLVKMSDLSICPDQAVYLEPQVEGGNPSFTYLWSTGATTAKLAVNTLQAEPYFVTVTDACGHQRSASARVIPSTPPRATISGMEEICMGDTTLLKIDFTGLPPWSLVYSIDGAAMPRIDNINQNPYYFPATQDGDYELKYFSDSGCTGETAGLASVSVLQMEVNAQVDPVHCAGGADGLIRMQVPQDFPPYHYSWNGTTADEPVADSLMAGTYIFQVTDARGCNRVLEIVVPEPPQLEFPQVDCELVRDGSWLPQATGGTSPYAYILDGERLDAPGLMQKMVPGNEYLVEIEDARGCRIVDTLLAPMLVDRIVDLPSQVILLLGQEYRFEPLLQVPEELIAGVRWLPSEPLSCDDCLNPTLLDLQEGIYTIRVIDKFGCTDEAQTEIRLNTDYPIYMPNVFSPNGDDQNDRFGVLSHPSVVKRVISMTIYNRWGSRLFQVNDLPAGDVNGSWDGMAGNRPAPVGIYVYQIELELANGDRKLLSGDVLLVR